MSTEEMNNDIITENRNKFVSLLSSVNIENANIPGLLDWLDNSDFYVAPASTMYHSNYAGGLCQHSLNVYNNLMQLASLYCPGQYSSDTLTVLALLHDISKANFYEHTIVNKKVYNEHGSKHDNMGNFDWVSQDAYKVKDAAERSLLGTHEEASALMLGTFIPLTLEETIAVMHHHCGMNDEGQFRDLSAHLNKYPLLTLLHAADFLSTFINEKDSCVR